MDELGLGYGEWIETCPRCKRLERGQAYLREVNRGFHEQARDRDPLPIVPAGVGDFREAGSETAEVGARTSEACDSSRPTAASAGCSAGCTSRSTPRVACSASSPAITTSTR